MPDVKQIEADIINEISSVTETMGYSKTHGRILAVLLMSDGPVSLSKLSKHTKYSLSSVSISLDFLELLGLVKKFRHPGDRQVYVELTGDLLDALRKLVLIKIQQGLGQAEGKIRTFVSDLNNPKTEEERKLAKSLKKLNYELNRLETYMNSLAKIPLPPEKGD